MNNLKKGKRESFKTVLVLIAVFANIYIKKEKKQVKIGNHSLSEELYIIVSVLYPKVDNVKLNSYTARKMKFSIKDFFSKCDQIRSFLRIWSYLLKKSMMENFIFCAVLEMKLKKTAEVVSVDPRSRNIKKNKNFSGVTVNIYSLEK